jgi:hypothetical protein
MSTMPADAHPLTLLPSRDFSANLVDDAGNFMTRDPRILQPWPITFLHEDVAVTDPTGLHSNPDLVGTGCWDFSPDHLERRSGCWNLNSRHLRHASSFGQTLTRFYRLSRWEENILRMQTIR